MQILEYELVIPINTDVSSELEDARMLGSNCSITAMAPAALTNACKLEIGDSEGNFATGQHPAGTDIALAAGKAVVLPPIAASQLRVKSAGNEAAARTFRVLVQVWR